MGSGGAQCIPAAARRGAEDPLQGQLPCLLPPGGHAEGQPSAGGPVLHLQAILAAPTPTLQNVQGAAVQGAAARAAAVPHPAGHLGGRVPSPTYSADLGSFMRQRPSVQHFSPQAQAHHQPLRPLVHSAQQGPQQQRLVSWGSAPPHLGPGLVNPLSTSLSLGRMPSLPAARQQVGGALLGDHQQAGDPFASRVPEWQQQQQSRSQFANMIDEMFVDQPERVLIADGGLASLL